jgi:hypothetical protein
VPGVEDFQPMPVFSRRRRSLFANLVYVTFLMFPSVPACAQSPGATCGDPDANGLSATDGLIILNVAIGLQTCEACICDVDGSGGTTASDSLVALRAAVGSVATLACPACEQGSTTSVPRETTTSTTTRSTTTSSTTTTTLGGGDRDGLPKDTVCELEFRASGNGRAGFLLFDVFFDETVGDFESDDSGYPCRSLLGSDATAFGKDGDQAPGDMQLGYLLNGGFPLPNAFMRCSFVATVAGVDTSIFALAIKTSVNPFFQPIQVTIDVSAPDCVAD